MKGIFTRLSTILFNEFNKKCGKDKISLYEGIKRAIRLYSSNQSQTIDKDALLNKLQAQLESEKEQYSINIQSLLKENKELKVIQETPTQNSLTKYPLSIIKEIFQFAFDHGHGKPNVTPLSETATNILLNFLYGGS